MKRLLLSFILSLIVHFVYAQEPSSQANFKTLKDLKPNESCYTFESGELTITVCKGDDYTQLSAYSAKEMWLGKNAPGVDYSEVIITFSKPVSSVNFVLSHFNNDETTGNERVDGFHVFAEDKSELSDYTFTWASGTKAYPFSTEDWTTADPVKHIIKGTPGSFGEQASGRLTISSGVPFTQLVFRHTVMWGQPNGVVINDAIHYSIAADSMVKPNNKDSISPQPVQAVVVDTIQKVQQPQEEIVLAKETTKDSTTVKTPVKTVKPVQKTVPLKKTTTVKKVTSSQPVKTKPVLVQKTVTPQKQVVQPKPIQKTTPKKTATAQTSTKKKTTTAPKPLVKKEDSLMTYKLSQIKQLKVGEKIKLENVYFKQSLAELLPNSYSELDTLVNLLKKYPSLEIELQGHTDNQGVPALNQKLSEERVEAVKQYLIGKGISSSRLSGKGYGSSRPFTDNETEDHRFKNRRVEFMITKK